MSDDPMFDYILARSRTRESSTLTIATVAASASLVLLALYVQAHIDAMDSQDRIGVFNEYRFWLVLFGVSFSGVGILYREITKYTIHDSDEQWLRKYSETLRTRCPVLYDKKERRIRDPTEYECEGSILREMILRALLSIPLIAWSIIVGKDVNYISSYIVAVAMGFYVLYISKCEKKD